MLRNVFCKINSMFTFNKPKTQKLVFHKRDDVLVLNILHDRIAIHLLFCTKNPEDEAQSLGKDFGIVQK